MAVLGLGALPNAASLDALSALSASAAPAFVALSVAAAVWSDRRIRLTKRTPKTVSSTTITAIPIFTSLLIPEPLLGKKSDGPASSSSARSSWSVR